jgi:hypothetical protein
MMRILSTLAMTILLLPTASRGQTSLGDTSICYKAALASGQPKFFPARASLEDRFGTAVVDVKGYLSVCNPSFSPSSVHQVGYKIALAKTTPAQTKFVKRDQLAVDQFGTRTLTVVKSVGALVPSGTTSLDHLECYKAVPAKGTPKFVAPPPVSVTDAFGTVTLTLKKITKVCTRVDFNGEDLGAPQDPFGLVCYQAKLPAGTKFAATTVSVANELGGGMLVAKAVAELCVGGFATATTTTTTTTTSVSTTTTIVVPLCCSYPAFNYNGIIDVPARCSMVSTGAGCVFPSSAASGVCRSDGTCGSATGPGDCCGMHGTSDDNCAVFTSSTQTFCPLGSGTFQPNSVCTIAGCQ